MRVNVQVPFYTTELGIVKRGEAEIPEEIGKYLISQGYAQEIRHDRIDSSKPAAKGKTGTKSRNKRV